MIKPFRIDIPQADLDDLTDPVSDDQMLTDISLYWLTGTAASSGRFHHDAPRGSQLSCRAPLGVAVFAHDITQSVRPLAERLYDIRHWSEFERGGHFAAMEVPDLLAEDVRDFFLMASEHDWTGSGSARQAAGR
ncbi:hypothetical protein OG558_21805 [Kribbella sp. NBC_01510]|uniref:alpha/beta fold hydrolase n=1 Tax=Kribbella sp. NBC_01510 TaxID=2903581 RepID=UPI0038658E8A